jgi:hypothetical protein
VQKTKFEKKEEGKQEGKEYVVIVFQNVTV